VLSAGRGLDVLEIDHRELSRAHKHVVLTYDDKVKIFDYESAAISEYPRNLCRLTSWIFNSVLEIKLRREAVELLRKYKKADRELRREIFSELVSHTVSTLERHR
ncbi:MAG: hypothetical protein NZ902_06695, partial [Acidilobaceae archaeon]|nr:hypothetical protein [Acidilobaceae archaeon]